MVPRLAKKKKGCRGKAALAPRCYRHFGDGDGDGMSAYRPKADIRPQSVGGKFFALAPSHVTNLICSDPPGGLDGGQTPSRSKREGLKSKLKSASRQGSPDTCSLRRAGRSGAPHKVAAVKWGAG